MAIRDYLLTLLRGRQGLAESEYNRRQLALQQEQARAGREAQQQRAYLAALGQLGDLALKGVGMGIEGFEKAQAGEAAGRLAEAQARAQLEGLEEFSPEQMEVLEQLPETLEGIGPEGVMPTAGIEEKLARLKPSPLEPEPLQPRLQRDAATEDLIREAQKILEEKEKQKIAKEARTPEQKATTSAADMGPILAELGVKSKQQPPEQESMDFTIQDLEAPEQESMDFTIQDLEAPEQESMDFTIQDLEGPVEDLEGPVKVLEEEPKAEAAPAEPAEPVPEGEKALETAEKMTGMRIRRFKKSPNELAQEIVDQVYAQKPAGNPLIQFFSGDPAKAQREKLLAKAAVAKEISNTRKQLVEQDFDRFMKEKGMQLREDQVEVARLAKQVAMRKAEGTLRLKRDLPSADRRQLQGYDQAQDQLKITVKYAKKLLQKNEGFPLGKVRAAIQAYINENAGKQGSISTGLGAGAGLAVGGLNVNINQAKNKQVNADLLNQAFKQLDQSDLSPNQKMFLQNLNIAIQNIGKSMEGGKLTDKDLYFYLQNLISNDDPKAALANMNDLMQKTYKQFNSLRQNLLGSYEESALAGFIPEEPELFSDEEIEKAFEAGISPAAQALGQRAMAGRGPPTTPLDTGVTQALNVIFQQLLTETDPNKQKQFINQARKIISEQATSKSWTEGLPGE